MRDPEMMAAKKQQFMNDQRQRNAVEGKIGQCEQRFGLRLITEEKLAVTQSSTIALNTLVTNLEKLLELLLSFLRLGTSFSSVISQTRDHICHACVMRSSPHERPASCPLQIGSLTTCRNSHFFMKSHVAACYSLPRVAEQPAFVQIC